MEDERKGMDNFPRMDSLAHKKAGIVPAFCSFLSIVYVSGGLIQNQFSVQSGCQRKINRYLCKVMQIVHSGFIAYL